MAELHIADSHGNAIPPPTVSQGIATFPDHAADADALVVMSDRTLYRAKEGGRDQVKAASSKSSAG